MSETFAAPAPATTPASTSQEPANNTVPTGDNAAITDQKSDKADQKSEKAEKQAPKQPDLFEYKANGKTHKATLEQLIKKAELGHAADEKFQEAAKLNKKAEAALGRLRNPKDAIAFLQDPSLGLNKEETIAAFEEWYKDNVIEPSKMSPEQKKLADAEARLKKYEEQEAQDAAKKKKDEEEKLDAKTRTEMQQELMELVETSGLPKTRFTVSRMAHWMHVNEVRGLNAPKELIVQQVKKEIRQAMDSMVQSSDGEVLENLLGPETARKLNKHYLAKLKAKRSLGGQTTTEDADPVVEKKPQERIRYAEVNRRMTQMRLGKLR